MFQPGTIENTEWLSTIDPNLDVVPKGTDIMGRYAGADDTEGTHTSTYLVTIAVPTRVLDELVNRQKLPRKALIGSTRLTVPYPRTLPEYVTARLCPRPDGEACNAQYTTLLRHTFDSIDWKTIPRNYDQFAFPVFTPYEMGRLRWDQKRIAGAEKLIALKQDEMSLLVVFLSVALLAAILYIFKLKKTL